MGAIIDIEALVKEAGEEDEGQDIHRELNWKRMILGKVLGESMMVEDRND